MSKLDTHFEVQWIANFCVAYQPEIIPINSCLWLLLWYNRDIFYSDFEVDKNFSVTEVFEQG